MKPTAAMNASHQHKFKRKRYQNDKKRTSEHCESDAASQPTCLVFSYFIHAGPVQAETTETNSQLLDEKNSIHT